jgi:hypothetical protein
MTVIITPFAGEVKRPKPRHDLLRELRADRPPDGWTRFKALPPARKNSITADIRRKIKTNLNSEDRRYLTEDRRIDEDMLFWIAVGCGFWESLP